MSKMEDGGRGKKESFRLSSSANLPKCRGTVPIRCGELEGNGDRKSRVAPFSFGV